MLALLSRLRAVGADGDLEGMLVLFWVLACLRHAHLERSTLTSSTGDFLYANCSRGKTRKKGVRVAFDWSTPRPSVLGFPLFDFIPKLAERLGHPVFLIPARAAARGLQPR